MSYQFILELNGKQGHLTPVNGDWIKRQLGISNLQRYTTKNIDEIGTLLMELVLIPHQKQRLLEWLKEHPDTRTSDIRTCNNNRIRIAWNHAFRELMKEGQVIPTSHGRGRERTWKVKE